MKKREDIGLRGGVSPWLLHSHGMEPNFVLTPLFYGNCG